MTDIVERLHTEWQRLHSDIGSRTKPALLTEAADEIVALRERLAGLKEEYIEQERLLLTTQARLEEAEALLLEADPSEHCATSCEYCAGVSKRIATLLGETAP